MTSSSPAAPQAAGAYPIPAGVFAETVLEVEHYTDRLFRFRITRPHEFRFRSGEFVMIGLPNAEKPIYRAYSLASPSWDEQIEFFSIKVPDGPLTEHLQKIQPGDTILMRRKPTGTLVLDALLPGQHLYLFSTGTGIAPFASLIRDPETYEKFERVILTQTCRQVAELQYGEHLIAQIRQDEMLAEIVGDKLTYYTTVTREPYPRPERITQLMRSGKLYQDIGLQPLSPERDRVMICGSMAMLKETRELCEAAGLVEGANNAPGTFVVERAFVD
ncbi:MAG: ferredoxin--NADP reductase [Burkholderiaceae bacterium]